MFPMIATLQRAARREGHARRGGREPRRPAVPAGIMVEVPAAAVMAAQFAREADFFSIGTNDLTQYTLAMDRGHPKLAPQVDGLNPAVLRLHCADGRGRGAARKARGRVRRHRQRSRGRADPHRPRRDELSVSLPAIPTVKAQIRALRLDACRDLAERALAAESAEEVRALVPDPDAEPSTDKPEA